MRLTDLEHFDVISLDALNMRADMLSRLDNKYLLPLSVLTELFGLLADDFDVLEIDGTRAFEYRTCYFDDETLSSYFDHHQGRRRRFKVRTRYYPDTAMCWLELKFKLARSRTLKKRFPRPVEGYGRLDDSDLNQIRKSYREVYGEELRGAFQPTVEMRYHRITFVAKAGGERLTLDYGLRFNADMVTHHLPEGVVILEAKSANKNGIADKVLRALRQHPVPSCSKYCLALFLTGQVARANRFLPAMKKIARLGRLSAGDAVYIRMGEEGVISTAEAYRVVGLSRQLSNV